MQDLDPAYREARRYVRQLRGFYRHALTYLTVNAGLAVLNFTTHPERIWVQWMLFGWGIGLQSHALSVFAFRGVPGRDWEERKAREYLSKRQSGGS